MNTLQVQDFYRLPPAPPPPKLPPPKPPNHQPLQPNHQPEDIPPKPQPLFPNILAAAMIHTNVPKNNPSTNKELRIVARTTNITHAIHRYNLLVCTIKNNIIPNTSKKKNPTTIFSPKVISWEVLYSSTTVGSACI